MIKTIPVHTWQTPRYGQTDTAVSYSNLVFVVYVREISCFCGIFPVRFDIDDDDCVRRISISINLYQSYQRVSLNVRQATDIYIFL